MARLRDVPCVIRTVGFTTFAKRVWQQVDEDAVFTWGAALAYSWMFAIFPFLIFLLSLVPLLPTNLKDGFQDNADNLIYQMLAGDAAVTVSETVKNVLNRGNTGGFLSVGLLITIWAASGGMATTMSALDKAYDIDKSRPYWKHRLVAAALTIACASLVILVMVLLPVGSATLGWLKSHGIVYGWMTVLINMIRYPLAILLLLTILALIYHFGPSFKQKFHAVTPGAVFCIVVWLLLGVGFRLYLTKFGGAESYNKTYGAVAGAAILLLLFYLDGLVLLMGAEINSEIDFAVLGMSTGKPDDPGNKPLEAALEPDQQALAQELAARGAGQNPKRQGPGTPHTEFTAAKPLVRAGAGGSSKVLIVVTGLSVLFAMLQRRRARKHFTARSGALDIHRLRQIYPITHAIITQRARPVQNPRSRVHL